MKENTPHDAMGQRIAKTVTNKNTTDGTDKFVTTYYVRDPQGNVLAVYERKRGETGDGTLILAEQHLYGASRLGMTKPNLVLSSSSSTPAEAPAVHYELTNHLGNVLAVITPDASDATQPAIESLTDYYPFGMEEPGRSYSAEGYRYGFNTQEKVQELGAGHITALYWEYDGRLGRRWNLDPVFRIGSSYQVLSNCPILFIDPNGDDWFVDELGFWVESDENEVEGFSYAGNVAPQVSNYYILEKIGHSYYHKYTDGVLERLYNKVFGSHIPTKLKYEKSNEHFNEELLGEVAGFGVGKGIKLFGKPIFKSIKGGIKNIWKLAPVERGRMVEEILIKKLHLTGMKSKNFPVIDAFERATGVATSIKSLDPFNVKGGTKHIASRLKGYIDDLANFKKRAWGGDRIEPGDIKKKVLELGLPDGNYTAEIVKTIKEAVKYAEQKGIETMFV